MTDSSFAIQNNSFDTGNNKLEKSVRAVGGYMVGNSIYQLGQRTALTKINPRLMRAIKNFSLDLSHDELCKVNTAVKDAFKKSGLEKMGVEIINPSPENADLVSEVVMQEAEKGIFKFLPKNLKLTVQSQLENTKNQIINGQNAIYAKVRKKIIVPQKGISLSFFHEMGHAINANFGRIGKLLQGCRSLSLLALPIALIALLKNKKEENKKPKNKLDAAGDFIKNNAGKLLFATYIPVLAEEGLASLKGGKFAKQLLSPDLAKKVSKINKIGFLTYFMIAALSSAGLALGVKLRDKIVHGDIKKQS